jgi:hypothetical protein
VAATGSERHVAVEAAVDDDGRWRDAAQLLAAIAEDVVVLLLVVERFVFGLALAARGAEIALFALAAAADAGRVVRVVDRAEVAAHLAAAARDAGLVDTLVGKQALLLLGGQ